MDDKNIEQKQDGYINVDESTLSNPFSNAFKNILQKLHLIKNDQKLIGTKETNSKGYQITSKNPLEATDKKSLKAILRNAFESHQQKRAEKLREKNATNTMPKYTIGKQEPLVEQNQTIKDPTIEVIKPITLTERAAMKAQQAPTVGTISIDETVANDINKAKNEEELFESDSSTDGAPADADIVQEPEKKAAVQNVVVMAEMTVNEPINEKDLKSKTTTIKRKDEPDQRDF